MRLFVDNLVNVDFSYLDKTRGLVGETWLASVELEGDLDSQGMVCDFGVVKKTIRSWLDEMLDHRLLVPEKSACVGMLSKTANTSLEWHYGKKQLTLNSPNQALTFIPLDEIEPVSVAKWCIDQLMPKFPSSVGSLKLSFSIEPIQGPFYHYSHGLKKHLGNCQRIAHGHRSKIEIWINDQLDQKEMQRWAEKWRDVYIASEEDLIEKHQETLKFSYKAQQGYFELSIPEEDVYFITTDSTVEFIAQHIAQEIKHLHPNDKIKVKAYEGLGKGAVSEL